ncbi:CocE/NonD family hydrolase [Amycolatopsis pithecellobii]|uniref:CocE/NonD family hydrolase n=1 Tax=Amycolatopsis pithecellobii TaxID=664692 RepID=A0A6N7YMP3_9PSEU|nr:CocE/NonD family hydrolase [Amycolatopsis pithecellobii]MTD53282.1 CocE/NonD family hydrolase [Amycolatopsis pithecellobii]
MIIDRDVAVPVDDGTVLRADVFRPDTTEPVPVIMTLGPYGKGVRYQDGYAPQWNWLVTTYPDVLPGSTREYMAWETVDPETWVPWGYAVVRVDSRGAGRSPGRLDILSPREVRDYYDAIEWAGTQAWSNGKVGLNGISYYAINQWLVASLQPPHLAAMIPWEGAADFYRDWARHGGIMSNGFLETWFPRQVLSVQHGNPDGRTDPWLGESATGPAKLTDSELVATRSDPIADVLAHPLDGPFYRDRSADWSKVTVPFLSAASWGGYGLHPRGNFEGFTQAAAPRKWLEAHPGRHEEWFYLERGMALQKRFLDHFLKGEDNGWDSEPPVLLHIRRPFTDEVEARTETEWPLDRTQWTPIHLSAGDTALAWDRPTESATVTFGALGEPVTFRSAPLPAETELTGPLAATLFLSSSTVDADLFVTLQAFAPDGREVEFQGTIDPHTPLAQGWLRASHRKLDPERSLPHRPYHTHDDQQPLEPGQVYRVEVEIWPTCIVLPAGYRLGLQISGHDFEREPPDDPNEAWVSRGSGPWLHTHPEDRPSPVFSGRTTIHTGGDTASLLLLPVIPPKEGDPA